jgi:nucleotidyltransferase/DNA polymerase involved in DNA repair
MMDRRACINIFSFRLQIASREVRGGPLVIVDRDHVDAVICDANQEARRVGIVEGMTYREANLLRGDLEARQVPEDELEDIEDEIYERLQSYSPFIKRHTDKPGLFWADISGLDAVFDSLEAWANEVCESIRQLELYPTIVCGFTQFGTYAVSRTKRGIFVFKELDREKEAVRRVPLYELGLGEQTRRVLDKLDIVTVRQLLDLPPVEIRRRFGETLYLIHQAARGKYIEPVEIESDRDGETGCRITLEHSVKDVSRLLLRLKRGLGELVEDRSGSDKIEAVSIELEHRGGSDQVQLRLGRPTTDLSRISELLRLRLEDWVVEYAVESVHLSVEWRQQWHRQLDLLETDNRQQLADVNRALDRIRSRFGASVVRQADLRPEYCPDASFEWERMGELTLPDADAESREQMLVRRILDRPIEIAESDIDLSHSSFCSRPYCLSGEWWDEPFARIYRFIKSRHGQVFWTYFDRFEDSWFIQGSVD